ncbi:MAG: pyruvate kinase [Gemmatimonadetes bacterium]|nr:MAG: pyruvate kinase [Gemmatimonadota bacterium]
MRRTKIVATLGPATGKESTIAALLQAGANVLRINASHGTPELRAEWIAAARKVAARSDSPIAVLLDLQGPRIRVGDLPAPRELKPGQEVAFAPEEVARADELPTTYDGLANDARVGSRILLNDGLLSVEVSAPALTEKDREDVKDALKIGVDYLALSFVRRPEDIEELRGLVRGASSKLVAKIEKATALDNLDKIVAVSDAVMVARGDLGVELPFEQVPLVQKRLIAEANHQGRPVITATQMLESMVHNPRPTRAEASDVANAILDGTDAVMLSAETAVGQYPVEAVRAMDRIIREMERHPLRHREERRRESESVHTEDAIAWGTYAVARMLKTPLIVTLTKGGFTARKVAALRPPVPILAVTTEASTYRQLALVWGVMPILVDHVPGYDAMLTVVRDLILKRQYAKSGDCIVMTAGVPWDVSGSTNLIKVEVV